MKTIDLNCDLGEGSGVEPTETDCQLMELITSANIACGAHAGNPELMATTVRLAKKKHVAIGAHPGYADRENFGRREMNLSGEEIQRLVTNQVNSLLEIVRSQHTELGHVKPHGALYNQAAKDIWIARAIADAIKAINPRLILIGLAGSRLVEAGLEVGLPTAHEGFPERAYEPDGSLRSRSLPGALISDTEAAAKQGLRLAVEGIQVRQGRVQVDTLCIHSDSPGAQEIARRVRSILLENYIQISSISFNDI